MQSACAVLCCHQSPVCRYCVFVTLSYEPPAFGKKLLNIECAFWFSLQLLSEIFLVLRRNERNITIHVHRSSCEVLVIFSTGFPQILIYKISRKSCSDSRFVAFGQMDGLADMRKLMVLFRNFANSPKNVRENRYIIFPCIP